MAAPAPPRNTQMTYIPEPYERDYYEGLFQVADPQRAGSIGGAAAVAFFSRSKLPVELLKSVWTLADQPVSHALDRPKFAVAIRLIQLMQNGQKGQGPRLAVPPGVILRPAIFDGVTGVMVPLPLPLPLPPPPPTTTSTEPQLAQQPPPSQMQMPQPQPQQPPMAYSGGPAPNPNAFPSSPPRAMMAPPSPMAGQQQQQLPMAYAQQQQQQQQPQQPYVAHPPRPPSSMSVAPPPPPRGMMMQPAVAPRPPSVMSVAPTVVPVLPFVVPPNALAVQDPYTLSPQEQSRYEAIFGEYADHDGFLYGNAAVDLFSKSGLDKAHLATIWNMVDLPVDNRLDIVEFCLAMHLIVCVSKKQLPMPPQLPHSLMALKQHAADTHRPPPVQQQPQQPQQQQQPYPPSNMVPSSPVRGPMPNSYAASPPSNMSSPQQRSLPPPSMADLPSPSSFIIQQQQQPPLQQPAYSVRNPLQQQQPSMQMTMIPPQQQQQQQPSDASSFSGSVMSHLQGPPPLQTPASGGGTVSISDAFAELNVNPVAATYGFGGSAGYGSIPDPSLSPSPPPTSTSYQYHHHGGDHDDDDDDEDGHVPTRNRNSGPSPKPQEQQQQARPKTVEQLASSYQVGEVREELEKLKTVMQKLQAENISLKAQLGNMTEEERDVHKQLGATIAEISRLSTDLTTLRAGVLASKARLLEASAELKVSQEKHGVINDLIAEASATKDAIDEATRGVEIANETAHTVASVPPAPAPTSFSDADLFGFDTSPALTIQTGAPTQNRVGLPPPPPPQSSIYSHRGLAAGSSDDVSGGGYPIIQSTSTNETGTGDDDYSDPGGGTGQAMASSNDGMMYGVSHSSSTGITSNVGGGSFDSVLGGGKLPIPTSGSLGGGGGYDDSDGIMGGGPAMSLPSAMSGGYQQQQLPNGGSTSSAVMQDLEDLRTRLQKAEQLARDTEATRKQMTAQADELRRLADEAEKASRDFNSSPATTKKKGFMGRTKKKDPKEGEKLAQDARAKKDAFLQSQSQANDAQAVALQTKREADRLRRELEEVEIRVASAASMEQQQQQQKPSVTTHSNGGYPPTQQTLHYDQQVQQQQQQQQPYYTSSGSLPPISDGTSSMGGFKPGVMASGGLSIPTPSGDDPFSSPF